MDKILRKDALDTLPTAKFDPYNLMECSDEIAYLYLNSEYLKDKKLKGVDKDKLAFIRFILEKDTPKYTKHKTELVSLLLGKSKGLSQTMQKLGEMGA